MYGLQMCILAALINLHDVNNLQIRTMCVYTLAVQQISLKIVFCRLLCNSSKISMSAVCTVLHPLHSCRHVAPTIYYLSKPSPDVDFFYCPQTFLEIFHAGMTFLSGLKRAFDLSCV